MLVWESFEEINTFQILPILLVILHNIFFNSFLEGFSIDKPEFTILKCLNSFSMENPSW